MDMYREMVRSAPYAARKRAVLQSIEITSKPSPQIAPYFNVRQSQHQYSKNRHHSTHRGAPCRLQQMRNSRSHPNLLVLSDDQMTAQNQRHQYQQQQQRQRKMHRESRAKVRSFPSYISRANSQPEYDVRGDGGRNLTNVVIPQSRSSGNLETILINNNQQQQQMQELRNFNNVYSDPLSQPVYGLTVKPVLEQTYGDNLAVAILQPNVINNNVNVNNAQNYCKVSTCK